MFHGNVILPVTQDVKVRKLIFYRCSTRKYKESSVWILFSELWAITSEYYVCIVEKISVNNIERVNCKKRKYYNQGNNLRNWFR